MLEIVNGMSEYGVLKMSKLFKKENIIEMALILNYVTEQSIPEGTVINNELELEIKLNKKV